jgi:hypothetical protein
MKNKKSLYILIPLVAIIWGFIMWKIFSFSSTEEDYIYQVTSKELIESSDTISYQLIVNYPDPFLRNNNYTGSINKNKKPVSGFSEIRVKNLKSLIKLPEISYAGLIEHDNSKVALITFKNSKHLLKKGDLIDDITIIEIYPDSLTVSYLDKTYAYARK